MAVSKAVPNMCLEAKAPPAARLCRGWGCDSRPERSFIFDQITLSKMNCSKRAIRISAIPMHKFLKPRLALVCAPYRLGKLVDRCFCKFENACRVATH